MKTRKIISALSAVILFLGGCGIPTLPDKSDFKSRPGNSQSEIPVEGWKESAPGLAYRYVRTDSGDGDDLKDFFVVRINPSRYSFEIFQNRDKDSAMTIGEIHEKTGSLLTFNGTFFTEDFKPTGMLVSKGETIRAASSADLLEGIFTVSGSGHAQLFDSKASINEKKYPFAIQNGPLLLDDKGEIAFGTETGKTASRTAIGIDSDGNIVLVILKQSLLDPENHITLFNFARTLKEAPGFTELGLHSVLNLDGGPSTGLMIGDRYFPELDRVQNVVIVKARP